MVDDTFRPRRPEGVSEEESFSANVEAIPMTPDQIRNQAAQEVGQAPVNSGFAIQGKAPPEFLAAMQQNNPQAAANQPKKGFSQMGQNTDKAPLQKP